MRFISTSLFVSLILFAPWLTGAQPTELKIDRSSGPARLRISGETGRQYTLEGSSAAAPDAPWDFLATINLTSDSPAWFDSASLLMPQRFYRAVKWEDPVSPSAVRNFRLIDHLGVSHELYSPLRNPAVQAVVLIFTRNGCAKIHNLVPALNAMKTRFAAQGVLFWMIDSNNGDSRSNILAEVNQLGIKLPVLHDAAELVAHEFGVQAAPEAIALQKVEESWVAFYRGAVYDRLLSDAFAPTQQYLSNALSSFLASQPVAVLASRAEGCDLGLTPPQEISYSADIAPLLQAKCIRCHSPGNIAPFSMTDYDSVELWSQAMKTEVLAGRMPPWHADPRYGAFANDGSLKPAEAARLLQWIDEGAPRGAGPDPLTDVPPPPADWPLGQPDLIVRIPQQSIPATGQVNYRYFNVTATFATDVWLRAAAVRPGNKKVVHHCLVYFGANSQIQGMDGFFAGYVPGYEQVLFPEGTGKFLPKGTVLRFQMHYVTIGEPASDQTELGLYTMPSPPARSLQTKSAYNPFFSIPAGNPDFQATAQFGPFNKPVYIYEMSPHMHLRGSRFKYEAVYPAGSNPATEVLLSVPFYEFHWQTLYRLSQPKWLPAGTKILCTGAWDNSPQNPDNPTNPGAPVGVGFGEQTDDEMFIGYFNYAEAP